MLSAERLRWPSSSLLGALALAGCSPEFEKMRSELDRLAVPEEYSLRWEHEEGSVPGFFGDGPRVRRRFTTRKEFSVVCNEIQSIAEPYAGETSGVSVREVSGRPVCSVWFEMEGFPAGITVIAVAGGSRDGGAAP